MSVSVCIAKRLFLVTCNEKIDFSVDVYFRGIKWGLVSVKNVDRGRHIAPADVITY